MPLTLACGLCPLRIRVHLTGRIGCWWCPVCGCYNQPEEVSGG